MAVQGGGTIALVITFHPFVHHPDTCALTHRATQ